MHKESASELLNPTHPHPHPKSASTYRLSVDPGSAEDEAQSHAHIVDCRRYGCYNHSVAVDVHGHEQQILLIGHLEAPEVQGGPNEVQVVGRDRPQVLLADELQDSVVEEQDGQREEERQQDEEEQAAAVGELEERGEGQRLHPDIEQVLDQGLHIVHQLPGLRHALPLDGGYGIGTRTF